MKVNLLLLLLSSYWYTSVSLAQSTFRLSQDVASFDIAGGMVENSTGDLIFAGTNANFIPFFGNVVKMNNNGVIQWANAYTGGVASSLTDIKAVTSGGYIVTGTSSDGGAILIRIAENGTVTWAKRYQTPDHASKSSNEFGNAVIEASDGGFVVAGGIDYYWDGVSASTVDTTSAFAFKVNSSGTLQWSRIFTVTTTNPDEHYFNDVAEVADGYIFVGESSEGSGTLDSDGDYPRNALIAKTTTAGAVTYINRWGSGNTTSQGLNCATKLASGNVLLGGYDDIHATIIRIQGAGSTVTFQYGRRLSGAAFPPVTNIIQDIQEHSDGSYGLIGTRIEALSFNFYTFIAKFDPSTNAFAFNRGYLPIGLSAILPEGGIATDQGYYCVMTDQQATGFNYNIIRTDNTGQIGSSASGCAPASISQSTSSSTPTLQTITTNNYTNATEASFTPVVTSLTPTPVVHCIVSPCTPPSAATTVTATPVSICAGQSTTITASGSASNVTYNVYTAAIGGTNLGATPLTVSPTTTTTYYVETVSNSNASCVSTTRTAVTVTVNPIPTATPSSNSQVCEGQTIQLNAVLVSGATYAWTGPNGFSSTLQNPTVLNATTMDAGSYSLIVSGGGCSSTAAITTVSVTTAPISLPTSNSPVCEGTTLQLTGNTISGATYAWTGPNGFSSALQNPTIIPVSAADAGVYTLIVTSGSCVSSPVTTTVTVHSLPVVTAGSNSPVCIGSAILLTGAVASTYSWTGPNGFTSNVQNPSITSATAGDAGIYNLLVQDVNGCQNTATTTVAVVAGETVTTSSTVISCNGLNDGSATAITSGTGPYTYSWTPTGGANATATGLAAGTYTVTVTVNGCSASATAIIAEPMVLSLIGSSTQSSCISPTGSASVVATGGTGTYNYTWSPGGGNSSTASNLSAGTYTVIVSDQNGCSASESVTVSSLNGPTAVISASSDITCEGLTNGSATVSVTGGTVPYTYSWSPTGGIASTATNLGTGSFTVTVTDNAGCTSVATVTITEPLAITISETISDATCGATDGGISLSVVGGSGTYTYLWTPSGETTSAVSAISGGNYSVTVTDASGCSEVENYTVLSSGSLAVSVSPTSTTIDPGQSVNLSVTTNPVIPGVSYSWTPTAGLSCSDCANPVASPFQSTLYSVTVISPDGCTGSASAMVNVHLICGDYYMPTIFSPNDDLNNDELCVLGNCIQTFSLKIYDRWGELVFETIDQSVCWDGKHKGKDMNTASYVYVLELTMIDGEKYSEKGNLTLVR